MAIQTKLLSAVDLSILVYLFTEQCRCTGSGAHGHGERLDRGARRVRVASEAPSSPGVAVPEPVVHRSILSSIRAVAFSTLAARVSSSGMPGRSWRRRRRMVEPTGAHGKVLKSSSSLPRRSPPGPSPPPPLIQFTIMRHLVRSLMMLARRIALWR